MRFTTIGLLCSLMVLPGLASPVDTGSSASLANVADSEDLTWVSKRCCILCDNPYARCGSSANEKREVVETEEEALFGSVQRRDLPEPEQPTKRCCILCMGPNLCGAKGTEKREVVQTEEEVLYGSVERRDVAEAQWPAKRCCILCMGPARCGANNEKREVVQTLEEAVEGRN